MSAMECRTCGHQSETEVRRRVGRKGQVILAVHCHTCGRWLMPATEQMADRLPTGGPASVNPLIAASLSASQ